MSADEFERELDSICLDGGELDLHLAAELGKTLLDRNRELETLLKEKQTTIEDQKLEIEYLTKQTVALKEVNDSRLRIYEQLEVSIQDLERTNHRLQFENGTEKKHIKSLNVTIEQLEAKCEDLQGIIDDLRLQIDVLKKKAVRNSDVGLPKSANQKEVVALRGIQRKSENEENFSADFSSAERSAQSPEYKSITDSSHSRSSQASSIQTQPECDQNSTDEIDSGMEEMAQLLAQLRETRALCSKDERKIAELEEQLATMVQQNQALENQVIQLSHRGDDLNMKSMHEELTTLDEVKDGQLCSKCLRTLDQSSNEILDDDDQSMLDDLMTTQHRSSFSMNVQDHAENQSSPILPSQSANPYKVLVEKYEALVEVHSNRVRSKSDQCPSLQEEMQISGDFIITNTKDTDEESGHGDSLRMAKQHKKTRKTFSTPTDFSEAETSSSGFADETSNKGTQTEGRVGSFLCTIADGEDCKFSIYDDASPIDSRFRDRPEYRDLFKEIFRVLKKAAENKAEGEDLPLLDDNTRTAPVVPPVTPLNDQIPEYPDDDTQSVLSSTMSELSTQNEATTIVENIIQSQNQPIPEGEPTSSESSKPECVLRPLVRQPLEYLSVEVRKRSSSRRKNKFADRSDSPVTHIIGSPKITYSNRPNSGRRRKDVKQNASAEENPWNGNTLQFWATNRNVSSPTPSQGSGKGYLEFKPSSASQDLHKLKKLDMSYAEVLRNADTKKRELYRQRRK